MKLIKEVYQDLNYLKEETEDGKKSLYIEGIFMQADKALIAFRILVFT